MDHADALAAQEVSHAVPFVSRLEPDGCVVGSTRFCNIDHGNQWAEIGNTWLARSVQRTSVNSTCKWLLLSHAIERLGARQDAVLRQHRREPDGSFHDTVVYSILDSDWPTVKNGLEFALSSGR